MDEKLQQDPARRMTNEEAEAVIERFREEEEAMRQEMEARATMPTIKDLAEGLNVPADRVEQLLHKVRQESLEPPPQEMAYTPQQAEKEVGRQNRLALIIGGIIMLIVLMGFFMVMFITPTVTFSEPSDPPAPTFEEARAFDAADDASPGTGATAPEPSDAVPIAE